MCTYFNVVFFQDQYTGQRRVYQLTFTLLKMMARQNKVVQGRLFDRLDMLLSKEGAGSELAECLTEVNFTLLQLNVLKEVLIWLLLIEF